MKLKSLIITSALLLALVAIHRHSPPKSLLTAASGKQTVRHRIPLPHW